MNDSIYAIILSKYFRPNDRTIHHMNTWRTRSDRYSEQRSQADPRQPKPEMSVLGG